MDPKCNEIVNKVLTVLGFLHICLQPYYTHVINSSLTLDPSIPEHSLEIKTDEYRKRLEVMHVKFALVRKLCIFGGILLFLRFVLFYVPGFNTMDFSNDMGVSKIKPMIGNKLASTEWLRGGSICTWKGNLHLAWAIPMADPTYNIAGTALHSFLMFAPFFVMFEKFNRGALMMFLQGAFLWALGPGLAAWFTPNLQEQASIWCFFSIAQIFVMIVVIYGTFQKGKKVSSPKTELAKSA